MIVALGVDAIANAPLADVIAACQRRGIGAVCLTVTDVVELEQSGAELQRCGIALAAFRFSSIHDIAPARAARSAAALGATMLADTIAEEAWLNGFVAAGGRVAATVELDPRAHNVAEQFRRVADAQGLPSHILLRGGGPEAVQFEGRGIGSLMAHLSVSGYTGVLMLAPSGSATRQIWKTWLFHRAKWGCGSKTTDASLVEIQ